MSDRVRTLPYPTRERWQPLRLGLVDIFYYDYEEFWFRDGHLLLRGNNGTGKSKVLALTLPFLLDAALAAHRVEPDGDPSKRMEWNLLLGGKYDERLGYSWLEFGRLDPAGGAQFCTVGCGMKAVAGKGIADHWFFLTSRRIGVDAFLIGGSGTAMTRDRLEEHLAGSGRVFRSAQQYRRAVDEALFRLGEQRYEALVNLLVQLRQPQLSKRPDEAKLSAALSEALPPLSQDVLLDVAAAFHDLEQQREELSAAGDTARHVDAFRTGYRRYASVLARRQGVALRRAHSEYESATTRLNQARADLAGKQEEDRVCAAQLLTVQRRLAVDQASHRELSQRSELAGLKHVEDLARTAQDAARKAHQLSGEARRDLDRRRAAHADAQQAAARSGAALDAALRETAAAADAAGVRAAHDALVEPLTIAAPQELDGLAQRLRRGGTELAERRRHQVAHVSRLATEHERAAAALTAAGREVNEATKERDAAAERLAATRSARADAVDRLVVGWRGYLAGLREVRIPDPDDVLAELTEWGVELAGDNPAQLTLSAAAEAARTALATRRATVETARQAAQTSRDELLDERDRLEHGEQHAPPPRYTRQGRDGRPGSPFWRVIDFGPDLTDDDRAGVEAALESAGLLDAWVAPDGTVLDATTYDVLLRASTPAPHPSTVALRCVIDPHDQSATSLDTDTVNRVLNSIGLGRQDAPAWVAPDGSWRLGPAEGRWAKPTAQYIGHQAREATRRRRLAELADLIAAAQREFERLAGELATLDTRLAALGREIAGAPSDQPLRDAHRDVTAAERDLAGRQQRLDDAVDRHRQAAAAEQEAAATLAEAAATLTLPTDRAGLDTTADAVATYRSAVAVLVADAGRHADNAKALRERAADRDDAERRAAERAEEAERAATAALERAATRDALIEKLGATVDDLTRRLDELAAAIADGIRQRDDLARRKETLTREVGQAEGQIETLAGQLTTITQTRDGAVDAFRRFAATGLLAVAVPGAEVPPTDRAWAADPTVRLARRLDTALSDVDADDGAWHRVQKDITAAFTALAEGLTRYGHRAHSDLVDGWYVVAITYQGQDRTPDALAALLAEDVAHRQRLLSAREREVIEEHLVNEVASHLQELISDAEDQVRCLNSELAERPTSTGVRLRLRWQPRGDGPAGLAAARARLLRQVADAWSLEDRAAVAEFLQQQIGEVRTANEHGTWLENLTIALDYRTWHRFSIERWQDGAWRPAGGPASGGERVLTVMLPMFAAASAHYRSAHPHAPRLVTLDEAFAGVDDDARAKTLGLLATFDLDYVLTSEREWGCYPTVPGLAICHLVRREGIDAVYVARWEWDGRVRESVEVGLPSMRASASEVAAGDAG